MVLIESHGERRVGRQDQTRIALSPIPSQPSKVSQDSNEDAWLQGMRTDHKVREDVLDACDVDWSRRRCLVDCHPSSR